MESQEPPRQKPVFSVWQGLTLVGQITGYILGPLILLGGFGFWLDETVGGHKLIFLAFCIIAFITSNYLVYKKATEISKHYR